MIAKAGSTPSSWATETHSEVNHTIRGSLITRRSCFSSRSANQTRSLSRVSSSAATSSIRSRMVGSVSRVRTPVLRSSCRWKLTTQRGSKNPDGLVSLPLIACGTW